MGTPTTTVTLNNQIQNYFSKQALTMLSPVALLYQFGEKTPLPRGSGTSVTWNGWSALAPVTGTLAEAGPGVAGTSLSSRKITGVVKQYGKPVVISDYVDYAGVFNEIEGAIEVITDCAKRSVEAVIGLGIFKATMARNANSVMLSGWSAAVASAYHAGSQKSCTQTWGFPVVWGSSATRLSAFQTKSASSCMGQVAIKTAVKQLRRKNSMEFADGNFVMLSNTDAASDLINDPDFKAWHQNIDNTPIKKGLPQGMTPVAKAFGVSVFATNCMPRVRATYSADVNFIFGRGAYGVTEFDTNGKSGFQIIIKRPGEQSTDNPMDLFSTVSFKFQLAAKAINTSAGRLLLTMPR